MSDTAQNPVAKASEKTTGAVYLSSSPHYTQGDTTQKIMLTVILSLLPVCISGVIIFGIRALAVILVSVISSVVAEWLFNRIIKKASTINDLSAVVTGILLALVLPSTVPLWMVAVGAVVAIVVAKGLFGGIGANVFNPALTGRGFMVLSFGTAMNTWFNPLSHASRLSWSGTGPKALDAVSSATALNKINSGTFSASSDTYLQFLFGNRSGCIGETSIIFILLAFFVLCSLRTIDWRASISMVLTVAVCTLIASLAKGANMGSALDDVWLSLLSGGLLFGAVFMVTDYATTPVTKPGRLIFGLGCGLITFLIRHFGGYPEGVMFSILIMNAVAPFLNNVTGRKYGYGKKAARRA